MFKRKFGSNGSFGIHFHHEMNVSEIGEVINKNGGTMVAGKRRPPSVSGDKTGSGANQLINNDGLTRGGGKFELPLVLDAFAMPRFAVSFAVGATRASRRVNTCKITWKMSRSCHQFENGETKVSKPFMLH